VELSNEELAARIKAGDNARDYMALLWERNKRLIYKKASVYENVISQHAFVDFDDLLQCGFLAMVEAVRAYRPEKGFKFITYINLCFQSEVHAMFGNIRGKRKEGNRRFFPTAAISLNEPLEEDEYETELIDALEDEEAGRIEENCERDETREIVAAAVERLPEKQRIVIREIYYNEKPKTQVVDGVRFEKYSQVDHAERSTLLMLRRDKALRALRYKNYSEPDTPSPYSHTPEHIVMAGEIMGEWMVHIRREMERMQYGLQTAAHYSNRGIEAI
jgi:RNA polymerase sporulation-specific sigma factor